MSSERIRETDPRIVTALEELQGMIRRRYPQASFHVSQGEDPDGVYLDAVVDVADTDEVFEVVVDRLLEMQVHERLPIYVIPTRPLQRVLEELQQPRPRRRLRIDLEEFAPPAQP